MITVVLPEPAPAATSVSGSTEVVAAHCSSEARGPLGWVHTGGTGSWDFTATRSFSVAYISRLRFWCRTKDWSASEPSRPALTVP